MGKICSKPSELFCGDEKEPHQSMIASQKSSMRKFSASELEQRFLMTKKYMQFAWEQNLKTNSNSELLTQSASLKSTLISKISNCQIQKVYDLGKVVGEGYCGTVRQARLIEDKGLGRLYAVKSLNKRKITAANIEAVRREIDIIKECDCYYIVQFYECYEDEHYFHIVTEFCEGGDLVSFVEKKNGISEERAKKWFWQAATAVNYLHHFGVVHRDIKLDNFMLSSAKEEEADLHLIDFGFATYYRERAPKSVVGTPFYVAPEVLGKNYSKECDVWSLGVLLYMMMFADPPFSGKRNTQIFESIKTKEPSFTSAACQSISPELRSLLEGLLKKNPAERLTISQALQNPWFNSAFTSFSSNWHSSMTLELLESLRKSKPRKRFQREVVHLMIRVHHEDPEVEKLAKVFALMDFLNKGVVGSHELMHAYQALGSSLTKEEAQKIIDNSFLRTPGYLSNTEFVAAAIDPSFFQSDVHLQPVFHRMDLDKCGHIGFEDIKFCFERFGYGLDDEMVTEFLTEFDYSKDGLICYPEFKRAVSGSI